MGIVVHEPGACGDRRSADTGNTRERIARFGARALPTGPAHARHGVCRSGRRHRGGEQGRGDEIFRQALGERPTGDRRQPGLRGDTRGGREGRLHRTLDRIQPTTGIRAATAPALLSSTLWHTKAAAITLRLLSLCPRHCGMKPMPFPIRASFSLILLLSAVSSHGQCDRWQQRVKYTMSVDLDATTHKFSGNASLVYTNNSPDTLREVFFHLYFNAFRPGSEMDVRS